MTSTMHIQGYGCSVKSELEGQVTQKLFLSLFRAMLARGSQEHLKSSYKDKGMRFFEQISQLPFDVDTFKSL